MLINIDLLDRVKIRGHKLVSACPACREGGADQTGTHFFLDTITGKFGCAAHPGDKEHRKRIWALVGIREERPALTRAQRREYAQRKARENALLRQAQSNSARAAACLADIVEEYAWDEYDMWEASPLRLEAPSHDDWKHFLRLWPDTGHNIWIGCVYDTGGEEHHAHFRTKEEWLKLDTPPGHRIAPATFHHGPSRTLDAVATTPFMVVDIDSAIGFKPTKPGDIAANKAAGRALIRWMVEACGLHLLAVLDTGSKGLHAYFQRPPDDQIRAWQSIANSLGIDKGILANHAAPLRLPGCLHEKTALPARLVFLDLNQHTTSQLS